MRYTETELKKLKKTKIREYCFYLRSYLGKTYKEISLDTGKSERTIRRWNEKYRWEEQARIITTEAINKLQKISPDALENMLPSIEVWLKIHMNLLQLGITSMKEKEIKCESVTDLINILKYVSGEFQRIGFFQPQVCHLSVNQDVTVKFGSREEEKEMTEVALALQELTENYKKIKDGKEPLAIEEKTIVAIPVDTGDIFIEEE